MQAGPPVSDPPLPAPPRRRALRLWQWLSIPLLLGALQLGTVAWRGEPTVVFRCHECALRARLRLHRLLGTIPVTTSVRVEDTPVARLLRDLEVQTCADHCWHSVRDEQRTAFAIHELLPYGSGASCGVRGGFVASEDPAACQERWDEELAPLLRRIATREPGEVRSWLRLLMQRDWVRWPAMIIPSRLQAHLTALVERERRGIPARSFRDLLPPEIAPDVWSELVRMAEGDRTDPGPLLRWAARHGPSDVRSTALFGLMNRDGLATWLPLLRESWIGLGAGFQRRALHQLEDLAPRQPLALPPIGDLLRSAEPEMRQSAAEALGRLGPAAEEAAPQLARSLRDPSPLVARAASLALARIAPADDAPLVEAMAEPDVATRLGALAALRERPAPALAPHVPKLASQLVDPDEAIREWSAAILADVAPGEPAVVAALTGTLADACPRVRATAARALGAIGPAAQAAIPDLRARLADADANVRLRVADALARVDRARGAAVALATAVDLLGHANRRTRIAAAELLGSWGVAARDALPALARREQDTIFEVREAAAEAREAIAAAR